MTFAIAIGIPHFDFDHRGQTPMVLEFRRRIIEASESAITGEEVLKNLDLLLKTYESDRTGLPV